MPHNPTYGVEMECYVPFNDPQRRVADDLRRLGINAVVAGYSGRDYNVWQIKTDGSLNSRPAGNYSGIEVVSPVLRFNNAEDDAQLCTVSEYLVTIGAKVNSSCGGHVHMYVGHLTADQLAELILSYDRHQSAIDEMISVARQAGRGGTGYARPMRDAQRAAAYARAGNWSDMAYVLGGHSSNVNGDHYAQRGTFEFRQRQASVNHYKIAGWVAFLAGLVAAAEQGVVLGDSSDSLTTVMTAMAVADLIAPTLCGWARGQVPTVQVIDAMRIAQVQATARVSRLLTLQGVV